MGRACWFGERSSEQSGKHEPTGKTLLPVCGAQLRDTEGIERSLVADVDLVRRPEYSAVVSVPVGRGNCATGRHVACLRRAVCAEATVSIHGQRTRKHREAGRITVAPAVPTAICLAGETERAFNRESSQRGREDRKENLLVVVKRSEVEIFALIGVLLCMLMWLKSVATPLAAVPGTHLLIWRSTLFPWLAS